MALRAGLRVCVLAAIGVTTACGSGADQSASSQPPPTEPIFKPSDPATPAVLPAPPAGSTTPALGAPMGSEPIAMVTDLASGWPITLRVGQSMTARLTADRTAGQRWSLRPGTDAGIVSLTGEPVVEGAAGAAVEVFHLVAVKPGQATLTFDFKKGADPGVIKSASYPVTVQ